MTKEKIMLRKSGLVFLLAVLLAMTIGIVSAQEGGEVVADGLNSPRHLSFGPDGTLYIAEAGMGGDEIGADNFGGEVQLGNTSQVTAVSPNGEQSVFAGDFLSMSYFGGYLGASKVIVTEDSVWVLVGNGPVEVPEGAIVSSLIQYDLATMEQIQIIDLAAFEAANNPDGDTETIVSNPSDFDVAPDGTIYIVDASGNTVLTWTEADGLALFTSYPITEAGLSAVPSAVDVADDGSVYVGFLGGFPFQREGGTARIDQYSPDGELLNSFTGVNLVTDVVYNDADGLVYAVELAEGFGNEGYIPQTGRLISIAADGTITPIAEALNFPYALAIDSDGRFLVAINSTAGEAGAGQVIEVQAGASGESPEEPAATESAG
jgi:hypothetical protein